VCIRARVRASECFGVVYACVSGWVGGGVGEWGGGCGCECV